MPNGDPKPKKKKTDEAFVSFLKKHSISGEKVLEILTAFGVTSLYELLSIKKDRELLAKLKLELSAGKHPIAEKALEDLALGAIENAIFFSENPDEVAKANALVDFLARNDVRANGKGRDELLGILRSCGVTSLANLQATKAKGTGDTKLKALTGKLKAWNRQAGVTFELITAAMVAQALRGGALEASPELKAFVKKKNLPAGSQEVLTEFGVTTLEQLKKVKEDKAAGGKLNQLKRKLDDSGILLASEAFDDLKVDDIEEEIAEVNSPEAKAAKEKSEELADAITEVQALREKVEEAAADQFDSVKTEVDKQFKAVLARIKDVSGADFEKATAAASKSKQELSSLLQATITNATNARKIMDGVQKAPRSLAKIMKNQDMLCGFLLSPAGAIRKHSDLIKRPEELTKTVRDPGAQTSRTITYKGSETKSFAASCAESTSSTLASAAENSGAGFVGTGIAAVSVAASYADSRKESTESQKFESATRAQCGEIHYIYAPKQAVHFDKREIRLSDSAKERLEMIVGLSGQNQIEEIVTFYQEYGSHFFLHYSLGGRYKFSAKGESYTETGKGLLITAVAETTHWAASVSGSYAGIGGAAESAESVKGEKSVASARGDRFALEFESAKVEVTTEVLGGAGLAPRDIWTQSLQFNSTWAVIDRDQPIAVWELVGLDKSIDNIKNLATHPDKRAVPTPSTKNLALLLEETWVREIYLHGVESSYPHLYNYLKSKPEVDNCKKLHEAVQLLRVEPEVQIVVAVQTSAKVEHPRAIAASNGAHLKLIGGGAMVDYEQGTGNLLTGSYPEGISWVASSKSHKESSPATVTAYAIYLYDPDDLWEVKIVTAKSRAKSNRPEAEAILPDGYALTGGGALVDWDGDGVLLTECRPIESKSVYLGWRAKGKDHASPDNGTATAWAFGIRPRNDTKPTPSKVYHDTKQGGSITTLSCVTTDPDEVIVGGGAAVTYRGSGGLLTSSGLAEGHKAWKAQAKDHLAGYADSSLDVTAWMFTRKGKVVK